MYKISISVGTSMWVLLFKEKESAEKAEESVLSFLSVQHLAQATADMRRLTIEDDYGQRTHIIAGSLHSVLVEDLDLTQEAMIRVHLLNQQTNVKAQQRVQNDPTLKAASIGNGGMMFDPMAGRRFS